MALGFQMTQSLVRPIGAMRTSLVTSSPSDVLSVTVVTCSRGSVLSIVNGMRTDLPAMPKVGASRLKQLDVGQPRRAAHRHGEDRHPLQPQGRGGLHRRLPSFQSPSDASTMPRRFWNRCGASASGSYRFVPCAGFGRRERLDHDVQPLAKRLPERAVDQRRDRLAARGEIDVGAAVGSVHVARVHAGRVVPEHGDRRLFLGPIFLDPFGLIEQDGHERSPAPAAAVRAARSRR